MADDEYRSPIYPEKILMISFREYSGIVMDRDKLRKFHKMIMDAAKPITTQEIERILEAAGF